MVRRWTAPCAALVIAGAIIAASVLASWQLFSSNGADRQSVVAGTQVRRDGAASDNRLARAIDQARQAAEAPQTLRQWSDAMASAHASVANTQPSIAEVLTFFNVMLYGPSPAAGAEPTVGEVLVFFNALLYPSGPTPPAPTVADTLVFFHALLYGGESTAAPPAPAPARPAPEPRAPVAPTPVPEARVPATPVPPPPPPPAPAASSDVWTEAAFTQAVWDGVNARRAQQGLAAVAPEPRLYAAARDYAVLIAETRWFSHTGPDGSSFVDRIVNAGFPFTVEVGEVLAMGSHDWPAAGVVQAWIDSAPHREQLMNPAYTRAGLECAFTRESGIPMVRCVMEFAAG